MLLLRESQTWHQWSFVSWWTKLFFQIHPRTWFSKTNLSWDIPKMAPWNGLWGSDTKERDFIDGHKPPDVVESRKKIIRKMVKIGFLHFTNAPTEQARQSLPGDVDPPILKRREKLSLSFMTRPFSPMRTKLSNGEWKEQKWWSQNQEGQGSWCQTLLMNIMGFSL